jgi:hypothetical protein
MKNKKRKELFTICFKCGNKLGKLKEGAIGAWVGTCDNCGEEGVSCASAQHDFGIYNNEEEKKADKIQRMI